jgi:hypothetical protein
MSEPLSNEAIEAIEKRLAEAGVTSEGWAADVSPFGGQATVIDLGRKDETRGRLDQVCRMSPKPDNLHNRRAVFIAAAPSDEAALLDEVKRLREEAIGLRGLLKIEEAEVEALRARLDKAEKVWVGPLNGDHRNVYRDNGHPVSGCKSALLIAEVPS